MTLLLASAARATTGARSGQEDAFRLWPADGVVPPKAEGSGLLAVLADGMGGHTGGAIAGETACKTFTEVFSAANSPFDARMKTALHASNEALAKGVEQNAALRGMGCTIVAAWIDDAGIRWTSVGDSLLLLYRLPDVIRLNADHSLGSFLDEQARQNRISRSEAKRNRNRNALRSALTGSKIDLIDLRSEPLEVRPGDWVLLASDGICSLDGNEIADVVYRYRQSKPEEMADALIAAVTLKGVVDQDNTTVVAVRVEDAKASATDDVTTRVVLRPKPEDADLRTRRIGVSRPVGGVGAGRKNTVLLATAAVLLISVAAVLIAWPLIRSLGGGQDAPTTSDTQSIAPSKTAVDPQPETRPTKVVPAPAPAKPGKGPSETGPQRPNRPANEAEDSVRAGQSKGSGSPKTGSQPAMESKPGEGDGGSRPGSLPPSTEGEEGSTQRGGQPGAALPPPASSPAPARAIEPPGVAPVEPSKTRGGVVKSASPASPARTNINGEPDRKRAKSLPSPDDPATSSGGSSSGVRVNNDSLTVPDRPAQEQ